MDHRVGLVLTSLEQERERRRRLLLLTWLEEEGKRRRRHFPLPPQVGDPAVRGWVHVGVCALVGALVTVLFGLWLGTASQQADRTVRTEGLRATFFNEAAERW